MKSMLAYAWAMLLVAFVAAYGFYTLYRTRSVYNTGPASIKIDYAKLALDNNLRGSEFVLTDQNGEMFLSTSLRGKVWLMSFFFSTCNAECLRMNQALGWERRGRPQL